MCVHDFCFGVFCRWYRSSDGSIKFDVNIPLQVGGWGL